MNTHKLPVRIMEPFEFSVLKKSSLCEKQNNISLPRSYHEKSRNLLIFAVVYGVIIGSLFFMLLNK